MNKRLVLVLFISALFASAHAQKAAPKILALKFHADWCGTCKLMGPLFEDLSSSDLNREDVLFYQFNFTDKASQHQARLMGTAMGVNNILSTNAGTGFILLVDAQSKKVIDRITREDDLASAKAKISAKLKLYRNL